MFYDVALDVTVQCSIGIEKVKTKC